MTLGALARTRAAWIAAEDAAVLARIRDEHIHLALWQRPRPPGLDWLDTLDLDEIDDVQDTFGLESLASALPAALAEAGYPASPEATSLAMEIGAVTRLYARVMDTDAVRMRLEIVETDACRRFHMDNVPARLLMPLTDPGTQWIESDAGADAPVNHLRAGDVGLFKGRMWAEVPAILHRSPPIDGTGLSRLLLVLDLPSGTEPLRCRP